MINLNSLKSSENALEKISNIRFPEDLSSPAIVFIAKKWTMDRFTADSKAEAFRKDSKGSVSLYLPVIKETTSVEWDSAQQTSTHIAGAIAGLASGLTGSIATDWLKLKRNIAVSQDSIATFKDVNNREFSFSFTFIPSSSRESILIKQIIDFFRFHSLPEFDSTVMHFPSIFYVAVLGVETYIGTDYFQFKPMALTTLDVSYGDGEHMQLMRDNAPQRVSITLSFREVTKPYKGDFKYSDEEYNKTVTNMNRTTSIGDTVKIAVGDANNNLKEANIDQYKVNS